MYPILIKMGHLSVNSWLLMALIGAWASYFVLLSDLKKSKVTELEFNLFFIGCVLVWFVGAHIANCLTVGGCYSVFRGGRIVMTGYMLYGGVISVILFGALFWRLSSWKSKFHLFKLWDDGSVAFLWALMFGRIGCWLYGCCYGTPAGDWPGYLMNRENWHYQSQPFPSELAGIKLHPTPLYEAMGVLGAIFVIRWMRKIQKKSPRAFPMGSIGWVCWISYGIVRFLTEFIRWDDRGGMQFGLSPSQWIAFVTIGIGIFEITRVRRQSSVVEHSMK